MVLSGINSINSNALSLKLLVIINSLLIIISESSDYSSSRADRLQHYSFASYCIKDVLSSSESVLDNEDFNNCNLFTTMPDNTNNNIDYIYGFSRSDIEGMITYDSYLNIITISFAGTNELDDWYTNMLFTNNIYSSVCKESWYNEYILGKDSCRVHTGFNDAYDEVKGLVFSQVNYLRNTYKIEDTCKIKFGGKSFTIPCDKYPTIEITGHSMGGAMAILSALHLSLEKDINIDWIYTFGQPRVGNKRFNKLFLDQVGEDKLYRITYGKDIVPMLPPKSVTSYRHFAQEIWYKSINANYVECKSDGGGNDQDTKNCLGQYDTGSGSDHADYKYINY